MTVLAFDCAVSGLSVAVVRDGAALARHREEGRGQAASLLPAIARVLHEAGVDRRALAMIAVTIGPGSFTGVRVGLAAARGLAMALDLPLAGIATTAALLAAAPSDGRCAVAAIDTHLGDWFCALSADDGTPFVAATEALVARLASTPCRIVGPRHVGDLARHDGAGRTQFCLGLAQSSRHEMEPGPSNPSRLAADCVARGGNRSGDARSLPQQ